MADTHSANQRGQCDDDGSTPANKSSHPVKINDFCNENTTNEDVAQVEPGNDVDTNNKILEGTHNAKDYINRDINSEDETCVNDNSLNNMDNALSGHSSDNQGESSKQSNDSDDSDSSSSCDEEDTQCEICQKIFLNITDLELHIRSRRMKDKRYMCCSCKKTFRDNTQLKVHARKHTGEKPFECKICKKKFTVNGNLNKHMRIHTGERRFECADCGKKFTQFAHLEDHLKIHSGERPFVCGYCQATFKTKARLRKHEKSHSSETPTKRAVYCPNPKCNIVLKSNRQLASHLSTHVQDTEGPFICHLCGKIFLKYPNLQEHQRSHIEMKAFFCDFCDKMFASGSHLRRHMNSHSGFRPYSCSFCKKGFPSSQNLKRHIMTHTGEKPYDCTDCGRKFLTLENLNRHRRTHTGEKPFSCEICGRFFAHSTTAKEHYRAVHTGEKPYGCSLCQQTFAISKMLYKHMRVRHPDNFKQFKMEQSLTPNMRKAMARFGNGIMCEDENMKFEFDVGDGNPSLVGLTPEELKNRTICETHFSDNDYKTNKRHFLKAHAVPKKFGSLDNNDDLSPPSSPEISGCSQLNCERCSQWFEKITRAIQKLILPKHNCEYAYLNLKVCATHVTDDMFSNKTKTRIHIDAFPIIFNSDNSASAESTNDTKTNICEENEDSAKNLKQETEDVEYSLHNIEKSLNYPKDNFVNNDGDIKEDILLKDENVIKIEENVGAEQVNSSRIFFMASKQDGGAAEGEGSTNIGEETIMTEPILKIKEEPMEMAEAFDFSINNAFQKEMSPSQTFYKTEENEGSGNPEAVISEKIKTEVLEDVASETPPFRSEYVEVACLKIEQTENC